MIAPFRIVHEVCGIVFFPRALFFFFMATLAVNAAPSVKSALAQFVYFGTNTRKPPSKGIYVARFDSRDGALAAPALAAEATNPTFLARHPTLPVLYAVAASRGGASANANGGGSGGAGAGGGVVIAYKINPETGALSQINQVADGPTNGTYVSLSPDGRALFTAHYSGGYMNSFPVRADGSLGECVSHIQHTMTGAHPQQAAPHPHCIDVSPDGRFAFVADLSADKIFRYRIGEGATLEDVGGAGKIAAEVKSGSGARHLAFSPDGRRLYLINELAATITACDYDGAAASGAGALTETQTVSTVAPDFTGRRWASEIAVHPNGKFLYASNRADDESIAVFAIDASTGKLAFVQRAGGLAQPRHFALSPDGRWLVCANQDVNDAVIFGVDAATGKLTDARARVSVPTCVCVLFWAGVR